MAIWPDSQAVTTRLGLNLQAKLTTGTQLVLTRAVSGAGFVDPDEIFTQTAVSQPRQELFMGMPVYRPEGRAEITVQLNNDYLDEGYTNWQIGIYAMDPDIGEILYMLAQASEPDPIPSKSQQSSVIVDHKFNIIYGQASEITVTVDPKGLVTQDEFQELVKNSTRIVVIHENIPVVQRRDNTFYLNVTGTQSAGGTMQISPTMGVVVME